MIKNSIRTVPARAAGYVLAVLTVGLMTGVLLSTPAMAQHKANESDLEVPTNDMEVVELGRAKYAQRCSFCHGGDGHGGKGPCLSCGKFAYVGNTNAEIYSVIAAGLPNRSLGGTMGAFGTTMSAQEILAVLTFLRWEEKRRIAAGEIPDPANDESNQLLVFPE